MEFKLKNLKGTKDYLPDEQRIRNDIRKTLEGVFQGYGYQPLETPTICYHEVLASKYAGGAEILKEVYKLNDQGNRELALRYDLTVPFAKVIGMNPEMRMPFKRYEIGKVFRDGPIKTGRMREFIQCDVDMVGVKDVIAEAELISMAIDAYKKLGLDVYISYNNRKLLSGILYSAGVKKEQINDFILSLDKIEKIGEDGVRKELLEKEIKNESIENVFITLKKANGNIVEYFKENILNDMIREGILEIEELNSYLTEMNIISEIKFNPFLARGLDIYTGTVFEVFLKDKSISSSIGGGGRYDKIIGGFLDNGKEYPAVGISFGLDVIFAAISLKEDTNNVPVADVYIIPIGTRKESMKIAYNLRLIGKKVDIEMNERKLKKSLDYANKEKIPYVIIIGEDEIKQGKVKLKNMEKGEEYLLAIEEVLNII